MFKDQLDPPLPTWRAGAWHSLVRTSCKACLYVPFHLLNKGVAGQEFLTYTHIIF